MKTTSRTLIIALAFSLTACAAGEDDPGAPPPGTDGGTQQQLPPNVWTVGPGGEHATFTAAVAALQQQGVPAGGLLLSVKGGEYPERFTVPTLPGASAADPVVFRAQDGATVTVTGKGTDKTDAMITLEACDHVTFDGINVRGDGSSDADRVEYGYWIKGTEQDGARNNTIRNCAVTLTRHTSTVGVRGESEATAATAATATCDDNTIEAVSVDAAGDGVSWSGASELLGLITEAPDSGIVVTRCALGQTTPLGHSGTTTSPTAFGISLSNVVKAQVRGNTIHKIQVDNAQPILPHVVGGISLDSVGGDVHGNKIYEVNYSGTLGCAAMGIRAGLRASGGLRVYNNFITGLNRSNYKTGSSADTSLNLTGIWLFRAADTAGPVRVAHNTIALMIRAQMQYDAAAVEISGGSSGQFKVQLHNNILTVESQTGDASSQGYAICDNNAKQGYLESDYNVVHVTGARAFAGVLGRELGGKPQEAKTLGAWKQVSGQDANSAFMLPQFKGKADLHLSGGSLGNAQLVGTPLDFVKIDIDGEPRSAAKPYRGADEVASHPLP